jgi:hypothetical protein
MEAIALEANQFRQPRHDESCTAYHTATGDEWHCEDGSHVLQHHISTPFFVRMGQTDILISSNFIEACYTQQGEPIDLQGFAALIREPLPDPDHRPRRRHYHHRAWLVWSDVQ